MEQNLIGTVSFYSRERGAGDVRLQDGTSIEFERKAIVGNLNEDSLTGCKVVVKLSDAGTISEVHKHSPMVRAHQDDPNFKASNVRTTSKTSSEVPYFDNKGYFSTNDLIAALFGYLLAIIHLLVIFLLFLFLLIPGLFGIFNFEARLLVSLLAIVLYLLAAGALSTLVAINDHLREIRRRG